MKKMVLLVSALLVAASGYAEINDSLKVENVMCVENPERVTITESNNRFMVKIDGKKDNPNFRYVREVEISPSDVSVTQERSSDWDFNIPFRKRTTAQRYKRNEFVVKDFKIGLSTVQGAPDNMDVSMGSSWEITTPTLGWAYYPWSTETSLSIGLACSWRNYRMTGKSRFIKDAETGVSIGSYPEGADIQFSRIKVFSWAFPVMFTHETSNKFNFSLGAIVNFNTHGSLKTRYKLDGKEYKLTDDNIHQTPVTVDIQASVGYKSLGFYVKYSPCKVLDSAYGPEFSALSVGLVLF